MPATEAQRAAAELLRHFSQDVDANDAPRCAAELAALLAAAQREPSRRGFDRASRRQMIEIVQKLEDEDGQKG